MRLTSEAPFTHSNFQLDNFTIFLQFRSQKLASAVGIPTAKLMMKMIYLIISVGNDGWLETSHVRTHRMLATAGDYRILSDFSNPRSFWTFWSESRWDWDNRCCCCCCCRRQGGEVNDKVRRQATTSRNIGNSLHDLHEGRWLQLVPAEKFSHQRLDRGECSNR